MFLTEGFQRHEPQKGMHRLSVVRVYASKDKDEIDDLERKLKQGIGYQMVEVKDLRKGETV